MGGARRGDAQGGLDARTLEGTQTHGRMNPASDRRGDGEQGNTARAGRKR
jgi:hypothetical protein